MSEMPGFHKAWAAVAVGRGGDPVSSELRPLLERVYVDILSSPIDLAALKNGLEDLLAFLSSRGRTNANCWAVDLFFCRSDSHATPPQCSTAVAVGTAPAPARQRLAPCPEGWRR